MLAAYLNARPHTPRFIRSPRQELAALSGVFIVSAGAMGVFLGQAGPIAAALSLVAAATCGVRAFYAKPAARPTPEQELALSADDVVKQLQGHVHSNRLHRALHPAVGATLEECAGYWMRIATALDGPQWTGTETLPQWASLRQEALAATKIAMDEALVHAGSTLILVQPAKPLEHVSDALEDIGFGPLVRNGRDHEPMPPSFRPVRELAERLREMAERCETAATQRRQESPEPVSAAFRRLDAALGEMRTLEEAEGELRQGA